MHCWEGHLVGQPDQHVYAWLRRVERPGRAAIADRDRDVLVGVLVEDDLAVARIGERPRGHGVVALGPDLELDEHPRLRRELVEIFPRQVELHVPETVD